jgi:uncharacterized protein
MLVDAGALVCLVDSTQRDSLRCRVAYQSLATPLVSTWPVLAEAMYLLLRLGGWPLQSNLWGYLRKGVLTVHASDAVEQERMYELMERYRDRPMDLADASLVAAAEALGTKRIFTIDSDFYIYQTNDREPFEVVP